MPRNYAFFFLYRDSSTKNTSSVGNTPPVQRSSLTDLTKAGLQASTASISAEVIRERIVAKSSSHQDVQVDIHQPKQPHHNPDETDVGPLLDQTCTSEAAVEAAAASVTHRRFSNLSNLAQSLPSTSSSASALVAGSVDFLTAASSSHNRGHVRGRAIRDRRSKRKASDQSKINANEVSVRRTQSAFETETKCSLLASKIEANIAPHQDVESEDDGGHNGSQSPLLVKRHQSLEVRPSIERHHPASVSSRSLDRHLEDRGCVNNRINHKAVSCIHKSASSLVGRGKASGAVAKIEASELSGSDVDMSNFQAEIDEATQALLKASQCKLPQS